MSLVSLLLQLIALCLVHAANRFVTRKEERNVFEDWTWSVSQPGSQSYTVPTRRFLLRSYVSLWYLPSMDPVH
ncbi:hypothetical protein QBC32DRAFT_352059 [Pseudoneurospora amorphoporcata]|uniref:Secreted protein n=1 Tax=Pseudoneurospora amorphoporcata TaxID=241081 RepID=A0AAN6NMB6_9PEZI|nr:hypothetical protein QBC32DRAFT_352059 [Pseudoneurospora amorphoporcata]